MFFDGPIFGLYKYGGRTMLSIKAKEGYIKALFETWDNFYLVVRWITRTKSGGDSVKSKLFEIPDHKAEVRQIIATMSDIVQEDTDIEDLLRNKWISLEEVIFKNETDLQQNLADFLPPREVYTSTTFLMQDSENMFEMTPADRINVFKNIFGLMNIDEAKDIISDAKKETTALLKSRRNSDDVNDKLFSLVDMYIHIVSGNNEWLSDDIISHATDWQLVHDKLSIENFDLAALPWASWQSLVELYDKQRSEYQTMLGQLQALEKQLTTISRERENIQRQKELAQRNITELQKKLETDNSEAIKMAQENKQSLVDQQEAIIASLPLQELSLTTIYDLNTYISELTQKWKMLKQNIETFEQKLQMAERRVQDKTERKAHIQAQLSLLEENRKKNEFICDLIGNNPCPYVDLINSAYAKNANAQEELHKKELEWLGIEQAEDDRVKAVQELQAWQSLLSETVSEYKKYDFKTMKQDIDTYSSLDSKRWEIDKTLTAFEKEKELQATYKQETALLESKITHYDELLVSAQSQENNLTNELSTLREKTDINQLDRVEMILSNIVRAIKLLDTIRDLVATHKQNMIMIKQLEEREDMLSQLYSIFSKEIMIYVLQQTLPLFADVLNNLLARVVDYTVSFETNTASEKIELEIKVHDSRGERLVKSLSGWQKTVLRLTWTLAICVFTRNNALFLDETVNNIDKDTIGKVADLLEDFTKTHDVTFYIITHSEAIQEMEIWDRVISL